jgi:hypothetical protein
MPFQLQGGRTMNIKLPQDQGRSKLDQSIAEYRERVARNRRDLVEQQAPVSLKDVFERSKKDEKDTGATGDLQNNQDTRAIKSDGLNISFQFDLFYELTSKVEARMGQQGANRFVELSGKVSETFMGNFSLSIDPVGSFMNGTDKSLEISPETTNEFFDAVEGLADLSPEALENFLKESDEFFAELENTYGEAGGAFDDIKGQMQQQATAFFADVEKVRTNATGNANPAESVEAAAVPAVPAIPGEEVNATTDLASLLTENDDSSSLIEMFFNPEKKLSQSDYQGFLSDFAEYAEKFKQQMFEKLFSMRNPYEKASKTDETADESSKNLIDTAI